MSKLNYSTIVLCNSSHRPLAAIACNFVRLVHSHLQNCDLSPERLSVNYNAPHSRTHKVKGSGSKFLDCTGHWLRKVVHLLHLK